MDEILLERLTYREVGAAIADGFTTAIVACGAVEQHGPHLPLFMDAEHGTALAVQVARRLGNALVAPTIRVGCSDHHMAFAGTLSLRRSTFQALCVDYAASLAAHGFRTICFIPSHGGNFEPLADSLPELQTAAGGTRVLAFLDLMGMVELWKDVVRQAGAPAEHVGGHADIAEASIMLALHPDLVRRDELTGGYRGELTTELVRRLMSEGIGAIAPNGILGDATGCSAELGEACIAATANMIAAHFRAAGRV
jgi:creatinine amidohydrolase